MISIFSNSLGNEELESIKKVFNSKWLGMGPECKSFEEELAAHFKVPSVLLTNNCTSAIYIALRTFGIGPGDEVIIPSINFVGIANAVVEIGAKPVFADVDINYFNLTAAEVDRLKTKKTKAVFLLHYGGHPAPIPEIKAVCADSIRILEDSANSVSSLSHGQYCGTIGDAGVFSFDAMKTLVMGDGGALIVKDPEALKRAKALRYLGYSEKTISGVEAMKNKQPRWWEFGVEAASGRFISNDMLASIGRIQLNKLSGFIQRRKKIWDYYQRELIGIPEITLPPEPLPGTESSYYLYWIRTPKKRDALAQFLKEKEIYTTFRYFPLHLVEYYGHQGKIKNAEMINETTLNIPVHQNLSDEDITHIAGSIKEFFKA